jgi:hypothetical protein
MAIQRVGLLTNDRVQVVHKLFTAPIGDAVENN